MEKKTYARVKTRKNTDDTMWENARGADGHVRDLLTGRIMKRDEPWIRGHKSDYEFRKAQRSAADRGLTRKEWIEEQNNPNLYRPELPPAMRDFSRPDDAPLPIQTHETPPSSYRGDTNYSSAYEDLIE